MSGSPERAALEAAAARLDALARRLAARPDDPDELRALADEAMELSAEITERLPRALRERGAG